MDSIKLGPIGLDVSPIAIGANPSAHERRGPTMWEPGVTSVIHR